MYFFTADLHFGNNEIIGREARPFRDIKEFEDAFVKNVNEVATKDDTLYVIGDWVDYCGEFKSEPKETLEICRRLAPSVILIIGNNEQRMIKALYHDDFDEFKRDAMIFGFADVLPSAYVEFSNERFYLIHKPADHIDGITNLFGHTHRSTGLWKPYGLNMCADLNHFRPFSESEILRLLAMKRDWWDNDPDTQDR
ncbi:MAG: hypothetical protein J6Y08_01180 [Clostridiales bacterium]|nr:hypothetical protein [Clostridiales bacterium]